jgi:hypothetical protein
MTELVRYDSNRRRMYVGGRRLHHGLTGVALATIGIVLMWDDRHDAPWYPSRLGQWVGSGDAASGLH